LAPSTFYYHRNKPLPIDPYRSVRPVLREVFDNAYKSYGYRRVRSVLASKHNMHLSGKTVLKLMRQENRRCQVRRRKYRSYQGQVGLAAENLLDRDFFASAPNSKWVTDVTEFRVLGQKQYLSPVIDLFNGDVISYQLAAAPALGLVTKMLDKALATLDGQMKPMIHSDQGWHYRHMAYRNALETRGLQQPMSRKGNCLDNAVAENFFGHFKEEFLRQRSFTTIGQFKSEMDTYIQWYNNDRIRLKLKGLSPIDYRVQSLANITPTLD
jgi:putative transposase